MVCNTSSSSSRMRRRRRRRTPPPTEHFYCKIFNDYISIFSSLRF